MDVLVDYIIRAPRRWHVQNLVLGLVAALPMGLGTGFIFYYGVGVPELGLAVGALFALVAWIGSAAFFSLPISTYRWFSFKHLEAGFRRALLFGFILGFVHMELWSWIIAISEGTILLSFPPRRIMADHPFFVLKYTVVYYFVVEYGIIGIINDRRSAKHFRERSDAMRRENRPF
jgi:hypothetical protein